MKKKIISFVLSMVAVLSVCTVMASAECHFVRFDKNYGNVMEFSVVMPNWQREVFMAQGEKSFLGIDSSRALLHTSGTVNKAFFRVKNTRNEIRSNYVMIEPGKGSYEIKYNGSYAFGYGENVKLYGYQKNVSEMKANGQLYVY